MEKIRIAFCFSGQLRTWEKCYETWYNLIDKIGERFEVEADFFAHAWDFNTAPHCINVNEKVLGGSTPLSVKLTDAEKEKFINIVNPKAYLFETEEISNSRESEVIKLAEPYMHAQGNVILSWFASQFYSIMRSCHLKSKYELENNFRYDMCFRMRYDSHFDPTQIDFFCNNDFNIPEFNSIYACHTDEFRVGDVFWYSDSVTFNKICEFYRWMPIMGANCFNRAKLVSPEQSLNFYVKMVKMDIKALIFDPKVYRAEDYLIRKEKIGNMEGLRENEII